MNNQKNLTGLSNQELLERIKPLYDNLEQIKLKQKMENLEVLKSIQNLLILRGIQVVYLTKYSYLQYPTTSVIKSMDLKNVFEQKSIVESIYDTGRTTIINLEVAQVAYENINGWRISYLNSE